MAHGGQAIGQFVGDWPQLGRPEWHPQLTGPRPTPDRAGDIIMPAAAAAGIRRSV
jgi:hypothetical protein